MNSKLQTKILSMAAATLGLSLMAGGCAKKAEPAPAAAEGGAPAAGAESSCGAGSCGAAHGGAPEGAAPAEGEPAPAPAP